MLAYPEHSRTVIAKKGIVPDERLPFGPAPKFTAVRFRPRLCENVVGSRLEHFIVTRIEYFVSPA